MIGVTTVKMVRVAVDYRDGHYALYDPADSSFADGVDPAAWITANTVEISEEEWQEYRAFCDVSKRWYVEINEIMPYV